MHHAGKGNSIKAVTTCIQQAAVIGGNENFVMTASDKLAKLQAQDAAEKRIRTGDEISKTEKAIGPKAFATSIQRVEYFGGTENVLMGAEKKLVNAVEQAELTLINTCRLYGMKQIRVKR